MRAPGALVGAAAKEQIPGEPENLKTGLGAEPSPSGFSTQFKSRERFASWPTGHGGARQRKLATETPLLCEPPLVAPSHNDPNLAT